MSWITRCPDCDTVYKVASEQLQQAHGWLRCGACQHVFDSAGRVVAADVIPTLTDRVNVGAPQLGRVDLERLLHKESPAPVVAASVAPLPVESPLVRGTADDAEPSPIAAFEDALQSFKLPDLPVAPQTNQDELAEDGASFDPPAPALVAKRRLSKFSIALAGLLVLILVFQLLLALRSTMWMRWPQLGRVASQWCATSACRSQWQPPLSLWSLQVQPLALDGAGHRLSWNLSHSASEPLTVPDLALTLLNPQSQAVSSQHLTSSMTTAPALLGAGQVWQGSLRLDWAPDMDASRAQLRLVSR
jgi:predicted Zn finger-like uncharacterized protein